MVSSRIEAVESVECGGLLGKLIVEETGLAGGMSSITINSIRGLAFKFFAR